MAGAAGHLPAAGSTCEPPRASALSNYVAGAAADAGSNTGALLRPAERHFLTADSGGTMGHSLTEAVLRGSAVGGGQQIASKG